MKTLQEQIDELKAIAKERDLLDKKSAAVVIAAEEHCKYKVGSVHINDLEWCFTHMGKKFKVDRVTLQESRSDGYQWRIGGSILKADGSIGQHHITGTSPINP